MKNRNYLMQCEFVKVTKWCNQSEKMKVECVQFMIVNEEKTMRHVMTGAFMFSKVVTAMS